MVGGFMMGVALGQQLVGARKCSFSSKPTRINPTEAAIKRMRAAKFKAIQRMNLRSQSEKIKNPMPEDKKLNAAFEYEFKDDSSGYLLDSIRQSVKEFNYWIRRQTAGLLDLNMTLAILFIVRGIRKFLIEKQYPSAWQLIWWASSILRGWRFM